MAPLRVFLTDSQKEEVGQGEMAAGSSCLEEGNS